MCHTWHSADILDESPLKFNAAHCVVLFVRQGRTDREDMIALKPEVDVHETDKRIGHQARAAQQYNRKAQLHNDEHVSEPDSPNTTSRYRIALMQCNTKIPAADLERWRKPEQDSAPHRHRRGYE